MSVIIVEHVESLGSGMLGRALRDHGFATRVVRRWRGERLPPDADDVAGLVLCDHGPESGVGSPDLGDARRIIGAAQVARVPIICLGFGARLLASSLGGAVALSETTHCGWGELALSHHGKEDPLFAGQPWRQAWWQWNRERIDVLPPSARLLASVGHDAMAFAIGTRTYGFQHHWELTSGELEGALRAFPSCLGSTAVDAARDGWRMHGAACERLGARFAANIVRCLFVPDRQHLGRPREMEVA